MLMRSNLCKHSKKLDICICLCLIKPVISIYSSQNTIPKYTNSLERFDLWNFIFIINEFIKLAEVNNWHTSKSCAVTWLPWTSPKWRFLNVWKWKCPAPQQRKFLYITQIWCDFLGISLKFFYIKTEIISLQQMLDKIRNVLSMFIVPSPNIWRFDNKHIIFVHVFSNNIYNDFNQLFMETASLKVAFWIFLCPQMLG